MRNANGPTTAKSDIGRLDKGLDAAGADGGWTVVDMKGDWKVIFPSPEK